MKKEKKMLFASALLNIVYILSTFLYMIYKNEILSDNMADNIFNYASYAILIVGTFYFMVLCFKKNSDLKKHKVLIIIFSVIFLIYDFISGILGLMAYFNIKGKREKRELPVIEPMSEVETIPIIVDFILSMIGLFVLPKIIPGDYKFIIYIGLFIGNVFVFRKELIKCLKLFKEYYREYISIIIKTWFKSLLVLLILSLIIKLTTGIKQPTNQASLQTLFNTMPIYVVILSMFYAPVVEELLFRGAFRKFIKNKYFYIVVSGVVFGLVHVIDDFKTVQELLYVIVYSSLGCYMASIYRKTNNIITDMSVHFLQNTFSVVGMILLHFLPNILPDLSTIIINFIN